MSSLNKVQLIGRLGKDPELRTLPGGNAVVSFSLATSEKWKDKQTGEPREETEWHNVVIFGKLAEVCGKYLTKGSLVYLEGKNKTRKWEKDGITRYTTEVVCDQMSMLGSKSEGGGQQQAQPQRQAAPAASKPAASNFDDDIPF